MIQVLGFVQFRTHLRSRVVLWFIELQLSAVGFSLVLR